jgi:hypothetical protein
MNLSLLLPLLISTLVAIIGWLMGHWLNARRDQTNRRADLRIEFLLEAYRKLERASNRPSNLESQVSDLESAIADVQLLGRPNQVAMAAEFSQRFAKERVASLDGLISELRNDLRSELSLEQVSSRPIHLRIMLDGGRREQV